MEETSTWQHTTLTRDKHPPLGGIRTHNPSRRDAADPRLRPCGHWERQANTYSFVFPRTGTTTDGY